MLRVDFNIQDGENFRLMATLPTIKFLIDRGVKIVILSHKGRPKGKDSKLSLKSEVKVLGKLLNKKINLLSSFNFDGIKRAINNSKPGSVFLLENLRFLPGEEKNDRKLARDLANLGDLYVNDAFAVSHRAGASLVGITKFLPSYAGLLLEKEISNLSGVMKNSKKPLVIILGGAKISDKIGLIKNFYNKANCFLVGGGIANTLFALQDLPVGNSLIDKNADLHGLNADFCRLDKKIILPIDVVVNKDRILDIGQKTVKKYSEIIKRAGTIIWNGPVGYFEDKKFARGSEGIARAIIKSRAFSVVGGGETTSLIQNSKLRIKNPRLFVSTGGGAMLEYLAAKKLPALEVLK